MGRKKKGTINVGINIPPDLYGLCKDVGLGSLSLGLQEIWRRIKDDKEIIKKIREAKNESQVSGDSVYNGL